MRIDLTKSRRRPLVAWVMLALIERVLGMAPGPLLAMSYAPALVHPRLGGYILRGMRGTGPWNRGEAELIATFVSDLNTCHF